MECVVVCGRWYCGGFVSGVLEGVYRWVDDWGVCSGGMEFGLRVDGELRVKRVSVVEWGGGEYWRGLVDVW